MNQFRKYVWKISLSLFLCLFIFLFGYAQEETFADNMSALTQIQDLVKQGTITPQQAQEIVKSIKEGQAPRNVSKDLREKAVGGSLTPAEIEAGRALLKQKKKTGDKESRVQTYKKSRVEEDKTARGEKKEKTRAEKKEKPGVEAEKNRKEVEKASIKSNKSKETYFKKTVEPEQPELKIYGHGLFSEASSTFAPIKMLPVSNDYIVGPGDEIKILMWGRMDASYSLTVDNEGVINFPKIGPITVAGLTFGELKKLIRHKAEAITGVYVNISMGRLRTIQVFVLGEVNHPGVYTVSSLATVANALLSSGGPTRLGSLRNVQLKRQNKVISTIDLYNFLLRGDTSSDTRLMPGDVVFVPQVGPMITVSGNVNRPAIYELKNEKGLKQVLKLAGGLTPGAFNQRIQIERAFKNRYRVVLDITYDEFKHKKIVPLQDGDAVKVLSILPDALNAVYLYGNVRRPGQYAFKPGLRILNIIPDIKSLDEDTYFDYALVKRYRKDKMKAELIPFDLGKLLASKDKTQNIMLAPLDEIYIFNKSMFKDREYANVEGQVRKPGKYYIEKMRIKDLIQKAGDLTKDAYLPKAELIRVDKDRNYHTIYFNVAAAMADDPVNNMQVHNEDRIVIHSVWEKQWKSTVSIEGEVKHTGKYTLTDGMRLKDLIFKSGGFTRDAFMQVGHLYRTDWRTKKVTIHTFNVEKALDGDSENNLVLKDLDKVEIHNIWEYKQHYTVSILGMVNNPGKYPYAENMTIKDLILVAGNIKDDAYTNSAELTRYTIMEGKRVETNILNFDVNLALKGNPGNNFKLQPLDVVTIKKIPKWGEKDTVTITGEVAFPGTYQIREGERISSVLERCGGFTPDAYLRGAVFTRESVKKIQQKRIDDMLNRLESEAAHLTSKKVQASLSKEDLAAQQQFMSAQKILIEKLKESRTSGRVVVSILPLSILNKSPRDIILENKDKLYIPKRTNTVNVLGAVYNPAALVYNKDEPEIKYYLAQTGGVTVNADEKSMYLVRVDGTVLSKRGTSWFGMRWDSDKNRWGSGFGHKFENTRLYPGDTLVVPEKVIMPSYMRDIKDITQILYQIAVTAGVTITQVF